MMRATRFAVLGLPVAVLRLPVAVLGLIFTPALAMAAEPEAQELEVELARPHDVTPETGAAAPSTAESTGPAPKRTSLTETRRSTRPMTNVESSSAFSTLPDSSWRRLASAGGKEKLFDPTHFLFEARFGAYAPRVDEEFGSGLTPYAAFFGTSPKFYFGVELDWLPLRIPYVGSVGIAFGWGRVKSTAKAKTSTGDAGSDTSLLINPMYADAVVRFDGLLRRAGVPFVPYVKGGLGIGMWQATGPSGTSAVGTVTGEGTTLGLHLGIGGALALNSFDRRTAMAMRHESGIDHAYLWGEWMLADLDGFGAKDAMHVGASAGVAGLAIEY